MVASIIALVVGLGLLASASDQFVIGAARLSSLLGVSPIVIGVVVVGFGTSAPEALVSVLAALDDEPTVAIGNVVGSNLVNVSLLLGVGALLTPLAVHSGVLRREAPLTVAATAAFAITVQDGFTRVEGVILVLLLAAAIVVVLRSAAPSDAVGDDAADLVAGAHRRGVEIVRTAIGLIGTVAGAQLLLTGAVDLATEIGMSASVIGATIVAGGTSLPELVTVVQSARRRETDLIVGNLLGSNLLNALGVSGLAAVVGPASVDAPELTTTATTAAGVAILVAWLMLATGQRVTPREGVVLIVGYVVAIAAVGV